MGYNDDIKTLKAALSVLSNQMSTLECDINRAKIDGSSVHIANNVKQSIHMAREEIKEMEKDLFSEYIASMAQVFRQHSILHSQATEYIFNDGKITADEKEMLMQSLKDLDACANNFRNIIIEFAEE